MTLSVPSFPPKEGICQIWHTAWIRAYWLGSENLRRGVGAGGFGRWTLAPDGKSCAHCYARLLLDLFVVEGLK